MHFDHFVSNPCHINQFLLLSLAPPSCLNGKDKVNLVDGGQRAIEDLKIGDRIWTLNHHGTALFQDEVIFMMDNGPNKTGNFHVPSPTIPHSVFII